MKEHQRHGHPGKPPSSSADKVQNLPKSCFFGVSGTLKNLRHVAFAIFPCIPTRIPLLWKPTLQKTMLEGR